MKNIFIIGLVVFSLGYMVSILMDRYNNIVQEDKNKKTLQQKQ